MEGRTFKTTLPSPHSDDGSDTGGAPSMAGGNPNSALMSIISTLEKEKMRLMDQLARDRQSAQELQEQVALLENKILAQRAKLSNYNALFMRLPDADVKAPRQRLGAIEAVLGTKRIIHKELTRLENDIIVSEMKLNKSKEKNQVYREKINTLRTEQATYKKMFASMQEELSSVKTNLHHIDNAIKDMYLQRDKSHEEMRELTKQFVMDKREKQEELRNLTDTLEYLVTAATGGLAQTHTTQTNTKSSVRGHSGHSTTSKNGGKAGGQQEEGLRRRIQKSQERILRDKYETEIARRKLHAFSTCLDKIKSGTGYATASEVKDIFNKYEEEKFSKAQQAQRLLDEIEKLEHSVTEMHEEVIQREEENARVKTDRTATIEALEKGALAKEAEEALVEAKAVKTLAEVKSLYKVIDYAFYALGLNAPEGDTQGEELTSPFGFGAPDGFTSTFPPSDAASSPMSPSSNFRARRLKMAAASSGRNTYRAGISASTLGAFMGSIQSGSADLIQQYVAFMNSFQQKAARGEADISYALSSSLHEPDDDVIGAYPDADNDIAETAHAITERRNMKLLAQETEGALRMLMSPGALGPSEPPGRTRTSIATSALMAALTIDTNKLTTSDGVAYDDETRPLSIAELKIQASRHFDTDPNVKSLKQAANAAASVLVNATSKVQSK